jgi:hypothetical protein
MDRRSKEFGKFCFYFFVFTSIIFFFISKELYAQGISAVWVNEGGDKVTQEELRVGQPNGRAVINHIWDGSKVTIKGARNEVVNFNIVIEAATQQTNGVTVSFNTLTGPGGAVIQSISTSGDGVFNWVGRPIELFYIRYLQIRGLSHFGYETYDERHIPERLRRPWTGEGYGSGTWEDRPDHDKYYPDIAVPLELESPFTIEAERNQSIWVDIYIPKTAAAGLYTGNVTIDETGGSTHTIPVELTVYEFTLPDIPTCKTMLYLDGGNINERRFGIGHNWVQGENEPLAKLIQDRHFLIAHRHKISLIGDDSWINSDYTAEDHPADNSAARLDGSFFTSVNGYDGPGVNTGNNVYSVGTYGGWQSWGDAEAHMREHSDNWVNWFETNSPETEYFLYLIDESSDYEQIETWSQWLENNPGPGNRLKSMATISLPRAVDNTPTLKIPASVSTIGIPSQWETPAYQYSHDPNRRFFLYNGSRPAGGGWMTEDDGVALRVNAWIQFKKHINRWFYWESTYYNDFQAGGGRLDVFESAHTFGSLSDTSIVRGETGYNYSNGDGVLFYPGTDSVFPGSSYGVNGPFASLRMKQWRRGLQDHDYLTLASAINPIAVQGIVNTIIPKVVWEVGVQDTTDPTWVRCDISWSNNPDVWEEARDSLAQIILRGDSAGIGENPYILSPNVPNPFDRTTTINYTILQDGILKLSIYDVIGREVKILLDGYVPIGTYQIEWDGTDSKGTRVTNGTYFCQLRGEDRGASTKKMILMK